MKLKAGLLNAVAMVALFVAGTGIGINCVGTYYQPKFPEKLNKNK